MGEPVWISLIVAGFGLQGFVGFCLQGFCLQGFAGRVLLAGHCLQTAFCLQGLLACRVLLAGFCLRGLAGRVLLVGFCWQGFACRVLLAGICCRVWVVIFDRVFDGFLWVFAP